MVMNNEADRMIRALAPEIDRKCEELRQARAERGMARVFLALCILAVLIPAAFVLLGISLKLLLIPVAFCALALVALSPILIRQQGGSYEQV